MWNISRLAAMALAGAGVTVTAATPAAACVDWGYSGVYSYGPVYARTGFSSYPAYHDVSCSGTYNIPGWGECGGYGRCGWAPLAPVVVTVPAAPGEAAEQPPVAGAVARRARRHPRG
jgi:hypothetical protein